MSSHLKAAAVGLAMLVAAGAATAALAHEPVTIGPMLIGYDLQALPENPSIEQQVQAGKMQLAIFREDNPSLDSNAEVLAYFNGIVRKLLAVSATPSPFPISVHVSTTPIMNALALPGGIIVVYEKLFDQTDTESELVSVLAHETAHQLHNDFLTFWHDYKKQTDVFGPNGVLEQSRDLEDAADRTGMELMYAAGWDPRGMIEMQDHAHKFYKLDVRAYQGPWAFYSTHSRFPERIKKLEAVAATLRSKPGLISDTPVFQRLKQKY